MKLLAALKSIPVIIGIVAVVGLGLGGFYYVKYQNAQKEIQTIKTDPTSTQKAAAEQVKKLVEVVGRLIELPKETPTVATITDVSKLKDQPFFAKAKNGDKVLIYTQAKKAILYRESENKIIDVAPVNIGDSAAQTQAKIVLANGTDVAGAASKVETQIKSGFPEVVVVSKTDAKGNYDKTIIVVLNDSAKAAADNLAKSLGATVGSLPSEESRPTDADILVLIGKDLASK